MLSLLTLALATPDFPAEVSGALGMPCDPTCMLCHSTASGGPGTATQPFSVAMMERGMVAYDVPSLTDALTAMESDGVDSDADGTSDIDELLLGADPNGGADFCAGPTPQYGCFGGGAALLLPLIGWGVVKRRRA